MNKKVAWQIISTFHPVVGGAQTQVKYLSKALIRQGWQVEVLTRQHSVFHPDGLPPRDQVEGIKINRLYSRGLSKIGTGFYFLTGLLYLWRQGRGSLYHAHDEGTSAWIAILARYLLGGHCLIKLRTGRSAYEHKFIHSYVRRWMFIIMLRLADYVVVVNTEVETLLCELKIAGEKVVNIPNGVDLDYFRPCTTEEHRFSLEALNITEGDQILLYVGRLEYIKGVDLLLAAWSLLSPELRIRSRLILVGDGFKKSEYEELIKRHQIADQVELRGEQSNVRDYYWSADYFVLPSRSEGLSNALVEAMACGLTSIASNVGGASDIISDNVTGYLCPSEDIVALAQRIEWAMAKPVLDSDLVRACARDYASQAITSKKFIDLYTEIASI